MLFYQELCTLPGLPVFSLLWVRGSLFVLLFVVFLVFVLFFLGGFFVFSIILYIYSGRIWSHSSHFIYYEICVIQSCVGSFWLYVLLIDCAYLHGSLCLGLVFFVILIFYAMTPYNQQMFNVCICTRGNE